MGPLTTQGPSRSRQPISSRLRQPIPTQASSRSRQPNSSVQTQIRSRLPFSNEAQNRLGLTSSNQATRIRPSIPSSIVTSIRSRLPLATQIDRQSEPGLPKSSQSVVTPCHTLSVATIASPSSPLQCPVCLEEFRSIRRRGSPLVSTICGHVFCNRCLTTCIRTSGNCPSCRMTTDHGGFHPLYLF